MQFFQDPPSAKIIGRGATAAMRSGSSSNHLWKPYGRRASTLPPSRFVTDVAFAAQEETKSL